MRITRLTKKINAPPALVYRALTDKHAVAQWMVPDGMTSEVHAWELRPGGTFRISLTYQDATDTGKSSPHTDTFHGRFVRVKPNAELVESMEFETADPALRGEMTVSYWLEPAVNGTLLTASHEDLPRGLSQDDNELGWRMSLAKLAEYAERLAGGPMP